MSQWYVKEVSLLTDVSVQTLHHYDRIDLLKPSIRLPNGYRLYSEKDLLKLQQIIALKYFGFPLKQIKGLIDGEVNVLEHFAVQSQFLAEKAKILLKASKTLRNILSECSYDKTIPWETIIKLIEVYRMTEEIEKSWASKALSPNELKDYVKFAEELPKRFTLQEKNAMHAEWKDIVREVNSNLGENPSSRIGIAIGKRAMNWVNRMYNKNHINLRIAIWEKGFKSGHGSNEHGLSKDAVAWLDKAMYAFHHHRIVNILNLIGKEPQETVSKLWNEMLTEMYGDEQIHKDELVKVILNDKTSSKMVCDWLKSQKK